MPFFKIQIPEKGNRFPPVTPLSQRYNNVWVNGGLESLRLLIVINRYF